MLIITQSIRLAGFRDAVKAKEYGIMML